MTDYYPCDTESNEDHILFDPNIGSTDEMFDFFPSDSESNEYFVDFQLN